MTKIVADDWMVVIGLANKVIISHGLRNSTLEKTIGWRSIKHEYKFVIWKLVLDILIFYCCLTFLPGTEPHE